MRLRIPLAVLTAVVVSFAFVPQNKRDASAPYGDLNAAAPRDLPKELGEISAMVYDATGNALYAVTDEEGILYKYPLAAGRRLERFRFFGSGDFEGLARVGTTFYALVSNGDIVAFPSNGQDVEGRRYKASFPGKTEFESLYYDPSLRRLVLLCKECSDDKKNTVSAFTFDPATKQFSSKALRFSTKDISEGSKKGKDEPLRASDAALHPLTGELYILASLNNLLVVADPRSGAFKRSYNLDKKLFQQPEGICFSPRGDLYISNEAGGKGSATLLVYPYMASR